MVLDAPLTLFWAIQQAQACPIKLTSHNQQSTVIYYLGKSLASRDTADTMASTCVKHTAAVVLAALIPKC